MASCVPENDRQATFFSRFVEARINSCQSLHFSQSVALTPAGIGSCASRGEPGRAPVSARSVHATDSPWGCSVQAAHAGFWPRYLRWDRAWVASSWAPLASFSGWGAVSSPVQPGDGQLQNGGKRHPQQIGNIHISHPGNTRPDGPQGPKQRRQDQQDVNGGQEVVFQAKLER